MAVKPIPDGYHSVTPYIVVPGVAGLIEFLKRAFDAKHVHSTTLPDGDAGVNARDRIGHGPWQNAKGVVVAKDVNDLHSESNNITKSTALNEKGEVISGRGDPVNTHDMLTGSDPEGMFSTAGGDTTCGNWTKSGEGSAIVGHHDRQGLKDTRHMKSWNSSHGSRGCSQDQLKASGGAGLFYCFAAN